MLYQNKQNEIFYISDLKESIEKAEKQGLIKLTDKQIKDYNNKPEFGVWNGNDWIVDSDKCEEFRISQIKAKASELITAKYTIVWQLNHPRTDIAYTADYAYIDNIRDISNEAEVNGTALEDIDWGV